MLKYKLLICLLGILIFSTLITTCISSSDEREINNLVDRLFKDQNPYRNFEMADQLYSKS